MKKFFFRFSFIAVFMISLLGLAYQSKLFHLKKVEVIVFGLQSTSQIELKAKILSQAKSFYGKFIFSVNFLEVIEILKKNLRIKEVRIKRELPNKVYIFVSFHKPSLLLMGFAEGLHQVVRNGNIFPIQKSSESFDLPILRGMNFYKNIELRKKAIQLIEQLPEEGLFSQSNISEIRYNKADDFQLYLSPKGVIVKVKPDAMVGKVRQVEKVILYLKNQKLNERIIDARLPKKILVKLKPRT